MKPFAPPALPRRALVLLPAAAALAACASRNAPPRRLYAMTGTPAPPPDARPGQDGRAWVLARQIPLPELLDRDAILVAEGSAGLRPWPEARWAEPLRDALPRVLAEDLARLRQPYPVALGGTKQVDMSVESLRLVVQVDEWLAREDGTGLLLRLRAHWHWAALNAPAGTALPPAGRADLSLACAADADVLAGAYRRSVVLLAARIVAAS